MKLPGAASAIFFNSGQACAAGSRLYIESMIFDDVVGELGRIASGYTVGHGLDAPTTLGPVISDRQYSTV